MRILALDPAENTGIALWDTDLGSINTRAVKVKSAVDVARGILSIRSFVGAVPPDFFIMERPFFPAPTIGQIKAGKYFRNLKSYETHLRILHFWEIVLNDLYHTEFRLEENGRIKSTTRARLVWPSTWQSRITKGLQGDSKERSARAARKKFDGLPTDISHDEYDAVCLCIYQWAMCRPLGKKDTSPAQLRTLEIMRSSGHLIPTVEEGELFS